MQDKLPLWRRTVKSVLLTLLTIVLLAAFYLAVIMGNPQEEASAAIKARQDQPLLEPMSSPVVITEQGQLGSLLTEFPAPVMAAMNSTVIAFEQGLCQDMAFEDGLGRTVTLSYRTADGAAVTVTSIYPARAVDLIDKGDYTISSTSGLPLAGLRSVRMDGATTVRMHAQGAESLYVVTLPSLSNSAMRSLTSTLQLYQGD